MAGTSLWSVRFNFLVWVWVCCLIIQQVLMFPLYSVLSTIFLYEVLGWRSVYYLPIWNWKSNSFLSSASAFVGLATMIVLFPVPGYIAKKVRDVQVQRMKMVLSQLMFLMFLFFLTDILFKFKTDARVQDVTEGTLHATWSSTQMQMIELHIHSH